MVDKQDEEGDTALVKAVKEKRWEVAELLVDRGALACRWIGSVDG